MIRLAWGIALFILPAVAHAETLSLTSYLEQVHRANPQVKASQLQAESQQAQVSAVGTWEDPFIAVGPDEIPFEGMGYVIRYQLSQPIPFPGKLDSRTEAQSARAKAAQEDTGVLQRQLTLTAVQTFFRLLYVDEAIELNRANQATLRDLVQSAKARYETGTGSHHEWLLATIEENTLRTERLRLERERVTLVANLNELRNAQLDAAIEPEPLEAAGVPEWSENVTAAIGRQPEFAALRYGLRAAEQETRAARLGYFPDFVVQGMVMQSGHEEEPSNFGVMLGATVPLFSWRRQGGAVDAAQRQRQALESLQRALELRLKTEWFEAERTYRTAQDTVSLYRDTVLPTTELALKSAQAAYSARTSSLADYLNVLRASRAQRLEFSAANLDLHLAIWRKKELLASPSITRFAPATPTLFSTGGMGGAMSGGAMQNDTGMGRGMPVPKSNDEMQKPAQPGGGGMKGM